MNDPYSNEDVAVDERPLVDQPMPEAPATAGLVDASGQMVQAMATGMAKIAGNIAGTIAGAMAAPLTAAAATAHDGEAPQAEDEARQDDTQATASQTDEPPESRQPGTDAGN